VEVTAETEKAKKTIGNTSGASTEDVERRKASHISDLIDQISGTSVNSLYARPEISVGVQGIAGHGRVSQQLEGVTQNFHAFTKDIGQTGSLLIDPQFLKRIEVTRGTSGGTGALGSLGSSVDFRYLDLEDILLPGKNIGGMVRMSSGFGKYKNGQKPSGSFFVGGRNEQWEVMAGASDSENEPYRIGSNVNNSDMLREAHARNLNFWLMKSRKYSAINNCRYSNITGPSSGVQDGFNNCQFTAEQLQWLKQASESPLTGTEKETDSRMLRVRHYFNDVHGQSLALFATGGRARYQSDQQPQVWAPENGGEAYWGKDVWDIGTELENQVVSLEYKAAFSRWFNPEARLYHEKQARKQRWKGVPGSSAMGEDLHYFVDNNSTGLKLSNASHFDATAIGPLRLDAGLELRRAHKEVDSLTEDQWHQKNINNGYTTLVWDPESSNDVTALALALSTEGNSHWQASLGVGWQRVSMEVYSPMIQVGNIAGEGATYNFRHFLTSVVNPACSSAPSLPYCTNTSTKRAEAQRLAAEANAKAASEIFIESGNQSARRWVSDDQQHRYDLKSAHFALQYTRSNGLSAHGSVSYSERAPTSNEMYIYGVWYRQMFGANPDLEPEKNVSLQLGVDYQHSSWLSSRDTITMGLGFYRNRIRNYIGYGPIIPANGLISAGASGVRNQSIANVNNLEPVIRQGFEMNLAYRYPLFYLRGNLTLPLRHDNKMCSWDSPGGSYLQSSANYIDSYTARGKGDKLCYSGWNWMETSLIEPVRGSLTAALTPYGGRLEIGGTVHYRGRQRAAYWYDREYQTALSHATTNSSETLPDKEDWLVAYLWPKVIKVDLFANYQINHQLKVGVYLANLTDQMEATPTSHGYNFYPGRTLTAHLEYRF
jgi:heme acquisition protein HasR